MSTRKDIMSRLGSAYCSLALIHPPQEGLLEGFSSGLVALANYVTRELPWARVSLLDFGLLSNTEMRQQAALYLQASTGTVFVGVSTTTASYQSALRVARTFKAISSECVVIFGGHHASAQHDVILDNHTSVDYVVCGEGEKALTELLQRYPNIEDISGVYFRKGLGVNECARGLQLDEVELDRLPPTFQGWGLRSAPGKFDHTTYVSARGCPNRCAFCAVSGEAIRAKSISAVMSDLRLLVGEMGYRSIAIEDNFFAQSPERTIELCRAIEQLQLELPFRWDCQTRVESCHPEVLAAMEEAGCEAVYIGVEAFDAEHLLYLRKTRQPGDYLRILSREVVPWLLRSQIDCYINLQLGLPHEGPSHRNNTLVVLRELGKMAKAHGRRIVIFPQLHVVYPGTRHFDEAVLEGRFGPESETVFERFTAWEARQRPVLRWLGEHFAHGTGGIPEGILCRDRLRRGKFEADTDTVLEVINGLNAIGRIPGIQVFNYGRYLTGACRDTSPSWPLETNIDGTAPERA